MDNLSGFALSGNHDGAVWLSHNCGWAVELAEDLYIKARLADALDAARRHLVECES